MHTYRIAVALGVALVLCVATGVSSASRGIGVESGGRSVTFTAERFAVHTELATVTCPVTLSGSFGSAFEKNETILIGPISGATLAERSCTGGSARFLTETLPWESEYFSFSGTLPRITALRLGVEEISALAEVSGVSCLLRGTPRGTTGPNTEVTEFRLDESVRLPITGSIFCPTTGTVSGSFRVSPTVRLSLVESLPGSVLRAEPTTLTIPMANNNGVERLIAENGEVSTGRVRRNINAGEPVFTISGCEQVTILRGGTCNLTVTKTGRPSGGTVGITYRNNQGSLHQAAFAVNIQ